MNQSDIVSCANALRGGYTMTNWDTVDVNPVVVTAIVPGTTHRAAMFPKNAIGAPVDKPYIV